MKYKITLSVFFIQFLVANIIVYAQSENEKNYFHWFDNLTDTRNSHLSNGISYSEEYATKKGYHQYYLTTDFLIADIVYDQQLYTNVNLQYNLFTDQVILRFYKGENLRTVQLIKDKVNRFTISGKKFIRVQQQNSSISGFYEVLLENTASDLSLYKRHFKSRQRHLDKELVYYSFKEKSNFFIYFKGKYHKINSKKDVSKLFPQHKKLINNFFSNKRYQYTNNKDQFMKLLFQQITNA